MKFADFIVPEAVIPELEADDKVGVIEELVDALVDA
ncbi:MAG: PTS sugar transporter subunit IIA, partial [Planctomycetota bacterium]